MTLILCCQNGHDQKFTQMTYTSHWELTDVGTESLQGVDTFVNHFDGDCHSIGSDFTAFLHHPWNCRLSLWRLSVENTYAYAQLWYAGLDISAYGAWSRHPYETQHFKKWTWSTYDPWSWSASDQPTFYGTLHGYPLMIHHQSCVPDALREGANSCIWGVYTESIYTRMFRNAASYLKTHLSISIIDSYSRTLQCMWHT